LWPAMVRKSTPRSLTSTGSFPRLWEASQCTKTSCLAALRTRWTISLMGCKAPVSLLECMMLTQIVRDVIAASTALAATRPSESTGRYVTEQPDRSSARQTSRTATCSVTCVMTWFLPSFFPSSIRPLMQWLMVSVPFDMKVISPCCAPMSSAVCLRAPSRALFACTP